MDIKGNLVDNEKVKKKRFHKAVIYPLAILTIMALSFCVFIFVVAFTPNVNSNKPVDLYVPSGSNFDDLYEILAINKVLKNEVNFWMISKIIDFDNVHPGYYRLNSSMNNFQIVRKLFSGRQTPVKLVINNVKTKEQLAGIIGKVIESDSSDMVKILSDNRYLAHFNVTNLTLPVLFLPDTYFVYWTNTPDEIVKRMYSEASKFWNESRLEKANLKGLSSVQITTLASIIEQESNKSEEWPVIAGVYLNRLNKNMKLQADPTVKYAVGDYSLKRIKGEHLKIDSPYNTYKYFGLPPSPIIYPSKAAIDAVLNSQEHHYYYFCAKSDFSGYHLFAEKYKEHLINAAHYRAALERINIH